MNFALLLVSLFPQFIQLLDDTLRLFDHFKKGFAICKLDNGAMLALPNCKNLRCVEPEFFSLKVGKFNKHIYRRPLSRTKVISIPTS